MDFGRGCAITPHFRFRERVHGIKNGPPSTACALVPGLCEPAGRLARPPARAPARPPARTRSLSAAPPTLGLLLRRRRHAAACPSRLPPPRPPRPAQSRGGEPSKCRTLSTRTRRTTARAPSGTCAASAASESPSAGAARRGVCAHAERAGGRADRLRQRRCARHRATQRGTAWRGGRGRRRPPPSAGAAAVGGRAALCALQGWLSSSHGRGSPLAVAPRSSAGARGGAVPWTGQAGRARRAPGAELQKSCFPPCAPPCSAL